MCTAGYQQGAGSRVVCDHPVRYDSARPGARPTQTDCEKLTAEANILRRYKRQRRSVSPSLPLFCLPERIVAFVVLCTHAERTIMRFLLIPYLYLPLVVLLVSCSCSRDPRVREAQSLAQGKKFAQTRDYARALLPFRTAAQATPSATGPHYQMG